MMDTIKKNDHELILGGLYLVAGMEESEAHRIEVHLNWPNMDSVPLRTNKWSRAAKRKATKVRALIKVFQED